jgi:hypothetical protein
VSKYDLQSTSNPYLKNHFKSKSIQIKIINFYYFPFGLKKFLHYIG